MFDSLAGFVSFFTSFFSNALNIIIALLVFAVLIFIHELGHYVFGKIFKFKINEFSIGFGKAIWSKTRKNGEIFSIRLIPLGGFCAFEGEEESTDNPDSFEKKEWWKRLIVFFGGAFFNFLAACLVAVALLMVMGDGITAAHSFEADYASHIAEHDLQENQYFKQNDIFLEINGVKPSFLNGGAFVLMSQQGLESEYIVKVKRDGEILTLNIINYKETSRGNNEFATAGLEMEAFVTYSFGTAVLKSVPFNLEMGWECLKIVGNLFTGKQSVRTLGGPITAVSSVAQAAGISLKYLLLFFVLLSVNLAVFNLLPIPALDGAHMAFVIVEGIRGKPINKKLEQKIHTIGLLILFGFIILIDFLQLFIFRMLG